MIILFKNKYSNVPRITKNHQGKYRCKQIFVLTGYSSVSITIVLYSFRTDKGIFRDTQFWFPLGFFFFF